MIVPYLPAVVAFFAVIVGIVGDPKWDKSKKGLMRLTRTGRATLAIALLALAASTLITWKSQEAADFQKLQRARILSVAHAEARLALRVLTDPFFPLMGDDGPGHEFQIVPEHIEDAGRLATLSKIDVRSVWEHFSPKSPWWEVLKEHADRGAERIDRVLQVYAGYLDPEVIVLLSELRTDEFMVLRLQKMDEFVNNNQHVGFLPFPFVHSPEMVDGVDLGYRRFWATVRKLDGALEKDTSKLRRKL